MALQPPRACSNAALWSCVPAAGFYCCYDNTCSCQGPPEPFAHFQNPRLGSGLTLKAAPSSSASMAPDPSASISSKHSSSCLRCSSDSLGRRDCRQASRRAGGQASDARAHWAAGRSHHATRSSTSGACNCMLQHCAVSLLIASVPPGVAGSVGGCCRSSMHAGLLPAPGP